MGEYQERLLDIASHEEVDIEQAQNTNNNGKPKPSTTSEESHIDHSQKHLKHWWLQVVFYTFCTIAGLSASIILGKLYYDKGGNSKWLISTLQTAGFPLLFPFFFFSKNTPQEITKANNNPPSFLLLSMVYIVLGVIFAASAIMYSVAIEYLPASTFTVVNSSQLAFNALFSFFLNAQVFTPYIINSVVLLTFSPLILVFGEDSDSSGSSSGDNNRYILGVVFTLGASAGPALLFSLTQLAFERIVRRENLREMLNMTVCQSLVATAVSLVGLFASGEWRSLRRDVEGYEQGIFSYFLNLAATAVACQAYNFGTIALTFKVTSLFSNVVIRLGTPIVPFLSVVFLHEKISGLKVMALLLALWGFTSYIYQHYLDDLKAKARGKQLIQ